jgi:hypothetical protein
LVGVDSRIYTEKALTLCGVLCILKRKKARGKEMKKVIEREGTVTFYSVVSRVDGVKTIVEKGLSLSAAAKICISTAMDWRYNNVDNHAGKYDIRRDGKQFGYNLRTRSREHGTVEMVAVTI